MAKSEINTFQTSQDIRATEHAERYSEMIANYVKNASDSIHHLIGRRIHETIIRDMKHLSLFIILLSSFFFISCAEIFEDKVSETSYWTDSYQCLELTPAGSANFYVSASGGFTRVSSTSYHIEKDDNGDRIIFAGFISFEQNGMRHEFDTGRFDKSRSTVFISGNAYKGEKLITTFSIELLKTNDAPR